MTLRVRRGTDSDRTSAVNNSEAQWEAGEPVFITDTGKLYIGDDSTQGGVLINPSIAIDSEAEADSEITVTTVIVERSRSAYVVDTDSDDEIDLGEGNNFRVTVPESTQLIFKNASAGQSGYLVITVSGSNAATINSSSNITVYANGGEDAALSLPVGRNFVAYTAVDADEVYVTSISVTAIAAV